MSALTRQQNREKWSCCLCHTYTGTVFMLRNELWKSVAKNNANRVICWDCCEKLLGRSISSADLRSDVPCNQVYIKLLKKLEKYATKT